MDRPRGYHIKRERERQIAHGIAYMFESFKNYTNGLIYKTNKIRDTENRLQLPKGKGVS